MVAHLNSVSTGDARSLSLNIAENGEGVAAAFHHVSSAVVERHGGQDPPYPPAVGDKKAVTL